METKFNHSIKVPNQYRKAAKLLKNSFEEGASLKGQIFGEKHAKTHGLYALIVKISKNKSVLDELIEKTQILQNEPRLDKYLCLVLMTELLFGTLKLKGDSKPVQCIRKYEDKFQSILSEQQNENDNNVINANKDVPKPRYVRVNTNLISRAEAIELFLKDGWYEVTGDFETYDKYLEAVRNLGDYDFLSDIHVNNLFAFPPSSKRFWARNALVLESKVILQDKASCLPAILLDPPKGSTVLDMCAAPGMKTSHLAAIMKNKGLIYAVEQHDKRYTTLLELIASTKSSIVFPMKLDALTLVDEQVPNVQYILVDPSCSGSGMANRLFASPKETQVDRLSNLAGLQIKMLSNAMKTFKNAIKVVYSTCSVYPEENEQVVQRCLEICSDWELIKPIQFAENWKNFGSPKYKHVGKKCLYANAFDDLTDGFFVAIFQRKSYDNQIVSEEKHGEIQENFPIEQDNYCDTVEKITNTKKREQQADKDHLIAIGSVNEKSSVLEMTPTNDNHLIEPVKSKKKKSHIDMEEEPIVESVPEIIPTNGNHSTEPVKTRKLKKRNIERDEEPIVETVSHITPTNGNNSTEPVKTKKSKKKKSHINREEEPILESVLQITPTNENYSTEPIKTKKKKIHIDIEEEPIVESLETHSKRKKRKHKLVNMNDAKVASKSVDTIEISSVINEENVDDVLNRKKKKKKSKQNV